ncbi:MAG: C-GCAxxG-C-C family protein [Thermoguttaceae bacterium]|nr:C-GCAxxG-C-C family protein [Thermoguttaceae bacterium]
MQSKNKISRRAALASGVGLAVFGDLMTNLGYAQDTGVKEDVVWKFAKLDPDLVAKRAYENFKAGGCLYGAFKGACLAYADAVEASDAEFAKIARGVPFVAFRCGRGGFGKLRELCGAMAGAIMFMSCFCEKVDDLNDMAGLLGGFAKTAALPTYVPENDECPNMFTFVADGLTCKDMGVGWVLNAPEEQRKNWVGERCARHTASIMKKAAEIINEHFEE